MTFRLFQPADTNDCLNLYRENRKQGFVPGQYEDEFERNIQDPKVLTLICEQDRAIVACGSITYGEDYSSAFLSFGLVHPSRHRQRIGSTLLIARMSLITVDPAELCDVCLTATTNSVGFYGKVVGFGEYSRNYDAFGNQFFHLTLPLSSKLLATTKATLARTGVVLEAGLKIPEPLGSSEAKKTS
jgi:hypothetical protein